MAYYVYRHKLIICVCFEFEAENSKMRSGSKDTSTKGILASIRSDLETESGKRVPKG